MVKRGIPAESRSAAEPQKFTKSPHISPLPMTGAAQEHND